VAACVAVPLPDSGILSAERVAARAARLSGSDAEPAAEPHCPDMLGRPSNLRTLDTPAFAVGDRVRTAGLQTSGHTAAGYARRRTGP
jgi:hypothetical protein